MRHAYSFPSASFDSDLTPFTILFIKEQHFFIHLQLHSMCGSCNVKLLPVLICVRAPIKSLSPTSLSFPSLLQLMYKNVQVVLLTFIEGVSSARMGKVPRTEELTLDSCLTSSKNESGTKSFRRHA